jgi:uncharacterized integral membrane protein
MVFKALQWIIGLLALISLLYFIAINPQVTQINWNPAAEAVNVPTYLLLLCTFVTGYILGLIYYGLASLPKKLENHRTRKAQEKEIKKLQKELELYRDTSQDPADDEFAP